MIFQFRQVRSLYQGWEKLREFKDLKKILQLLKAFVQVFYVSKKQMDVREINTSPQQHSSNIIELNTIQLNVIKKNQECIVTHENIDAIQELNTSRIKNTPEEYGLNINTELTRSAEHEIHTPMQEAAIHVRLGSSLIEEKSDRMQASGNKLTEQEISAESSAGNLVTALKHFHDIITKRNSAERGTGEQVRCPAAKEGTSMQLVASLVGKQPFGKLAEGTNSLDQETDIQLVENLVGEQLVDKLVEGLNSSDQKTGVQAVENLIGEQPVGKLVGVNSSEQETGVQAVENLIGEQPIGKMVERVNSSEQETGAQPVENMVGEQSIGKLAAVTNSTDQDIGVQTVQSLNVVEQRTAGMQLVQNIIAEQKTGKLTDKGTYLSDQEIGMHVVESFFEEQGTASIQFAENISAEQNTGILTEDINLAVQKTGTQAMAGPVQDIERAPGGQKTATLLLEFSSEIKTFMQALETVNLESDAEVSVKDPAKRICNIPENNEKFKEEFKELLRLEQYLNEFYESDDEEFKSVNRRDDENNFDDFEEISLQDKEPSSELVKENDNLPKRHGVFCCIRKYLKRLFCCIRPEVDDQENKCVM